MSNETLTNLAAAYRALVDASWDYQSVWMLAPLVVIFCGLVIGWGGSVLANKLKPLPSENIKAQESRNNKFAVVAFGSVLVVFTTFYFVAGYQENIFFEKNRTKIEMALELLQVDQDDPAYDKAFESSASAKEVLEEAASTIEPALDNLLSKEIEEDLTAINSNKPVLKMLQEGVVETESAHRLSFFFAAFGLLGGIGVAAAVITIVDKLTNNIPVKVALGLLIFGGVMSGARVGHIEFQQSRFATLTPETKQIAEKVIQAYTKYQIYPEQLPVNAVTAHVLISIQVKGIRSARFVSNPKALQPESRIEQVVIKWNQKSPS